MVEAVLAGCPSTVNADGLVSRPMRLRVGQERRRCGPPFTPGTSPAARHELSWADVCWCSTCAELRVLNYVC